VWNPHLKGDIEELENIQHRGDEACVRLKKKGGIYGKAKKVEIDETRNCRGKRGGGASNTVLQNRACP
jgi:hypothetical protein